MNSHIDIHNHILPEIDEDGPPDLGGSLMLARALVKQGFDTVIATPHSFEGNPPVETILGAGRLLTAALEEQRIPLQVLPGAETVLEPQLLERVKQGQVLTLNRSPYLLVELPLFQELPPYTGELLFKLKAHGYEPVLAHPERVRVFQKDPDALAALVARGVFLQLTLSSLTGLLGRAIERTSWQLLTRGLVHFLATDAHSAGRRLARTAPALRRLKRTFGQGYVDTLLRENPLRLLRGEEVCLTEPAPARPGRLKAGPTVYLKTEATQWKKNWIY